jgi:hypothetical protein
VQEKTASAKVLSAQLPFMWLRSRVWAQTTMVEVPGPLLTHPFSSLSLGEPTLWVVAGIGLIGLMPNSKRAGETELELSEEWA